MSRHGLSCARVDGVEATRSHEGAIAATSRIDGVEATRSHEGAIAATSRIDGVDATRSHEDAASRTWTQTVSPALKKSNNMSRKSSFMAS